MPREVVDRKIAQMYLFGARQHFLTEFSEQLKNVARAPKTLPQCSFLIPNSRAGSPGNLDGLVSRDASYCPFSSLR